MTKSQSIEQSYRLAKEQYAAIGVDTDTVLEKLGTIPISLHCWQTDDLTGFEKRDTGLSGGIQATGNYPGKARNIEEVMLDAEFVISLLPGTSRFSLHAIYGDFRNSSADRDEIEQKHFESWVEWAKKNGIGIDFNSTLFSHHKSESGYTLSSADPSVRNFWIDHVKRCREISEYFGKELDKRCIHNIWIPDGSKDITVNRYKHREILRKSLDEILSDKKDTTFMMDAIESKLFGIGLEAFTVGSHEFYLGYAVDRKMMLCLDIGHFHPTEQVSDKISAIFQYIPELLLHVTRPVRWDSDHVVTLNDDVRSLFEEIVWADKLNKVNVGLDFFDASINRVGAYITGTRAAQKGILLALLSPVDQLRKYENDGQYFERLALLEETKSYPFGSVWDYYCLKNDVPLSHSYINEVKTYEQKVLSKR